MRVMHSGSIQAQKHFQMVLEMEAPESLRGLARNGLREIAVRGLKARGPRMDAVFYLLDAMRLFRSKSLENQTRKLNPVQQFCGCSCSWVCGLQSAQSIVTLSYMLIKTNLRIELCVYKLLWVK